MNVANAMTQACAQAADAKILKFGPPTSTDDYFRPFEEFAWSQRRQERIERRKLRHFPRPD